MDEIIRIWIPFIVVVWLSLYLYDDGAHRVYDVLLSAVAIVVTSPIFAVLAVLSKLKAGRVFDKTEGDLIFAFPNNRLKKLPRLLLIFIGKRSILPTRLKDIRL